MVPYHLFRNCLSISFAIETKDGASSPREIPTADLLPALKGEGSAEEPYPTGGEV
ncbi:hypothetical protein [Thermococcus sp. CX2]|uniref:hypothetical protein n=1 Tax=Thermococcus sp. CX2 TaxID=163006 RepID=UPI001439A739|nr:hypothetical protein [Thermococcus sp. CX2]